MTSLAAFSFAKNKKQYRLLAIPLLIVIRVSAKLKVCVIARSSGDEEIHKNKTKYNAVSGLIRDYIPNNDYRQVLKESNIFSLEATR